MGTAILKGISNALLVTVLTLLAGMLWMGMGMGSPSLSNLVDIGLVASCLIGGYRAARESRLWLSGGIAAAGYVLVGVSLLALFLPLRSVGIIQVLGEGTLIGLVAGAVGAGGTPKSRARLGSKGRGRPYVSPNTSYKGRINWEDDLGKSSEMDNAIGLSRRGKWQDSVSEDEDEYKDEYTEAGNHVWGRNHAQQFEDSPEDYGRQFEDRLEERIADRIAGRIEGRQEESEVSWTPPRTKEVFPDASHWWEEEVR